MASPRNVNPSVIQQTWTLEQMNYMERAEIRDNEESSMESPPAYNPGRLDTEYDANTTRTNATVAVDGRVDINIDAKVARQLSKLFTPDLKGQSDSEDAQSQRPSVTSTGAVGVSPPGLNIVLQIVGSRGDLQPFIALGLELRRFGHRVRIATHPTFKGFVEAVGLEFFSIGGDPKELMAYMVKNPSLIPKLDTLRNGEVQRRRAAMRNIMRRCWRSCFEAGDGIDLPAPGSAEQSGTSPARRRDPKPFMADAIVANPPSFAHIHCAQKLGIPLHLMFTMPWTPTQAFAHPLANVQSSTTDVRVTNYLSYIILEMITWQGLGDIVNRFRYKTLGLEPMDPTRIPGMMSRLKIPFTYCWSPNLIPKPRDWGSNIDVAGFYFLPSNQDYAPPSELVAFIQNGSPPIYIEFGSIIVDDPDALTAVILEAIRLINVRAILCKGWASLGESAMTTRPDIFLVEECQHEWLFQQVSCVVHHGGAGTTAAGIAAGKPAVVVPFFGDQIFWGSMIHRVGAGPRPIPFTMLTASNLAKAIATALTEEMLQRANVLGERIRKEGGTGAGARSFHDHLPVGVVGCSVLPQRAAVWRHNRKDIRLSAVAATVLRKQGLVDFGDLKLYRPCEYDLTPGPWEPVSGASLAILDLFYDTFKGLGMIGSEFTRLPYVGQTNSRSGQPVKTVDLPTDSPTTSFSQPVTGACSTQRFIGQRAAKGLYQITKAAARSPMTFTVAMAQGAHNAPRMWGDRTVRPQPKVTGLGTGLMAGCKELFLGTYDGIAGLVTQPVLGAKEDGVLGLIKGFAKGVVGTPVKFWAGMNGIVGYPLKGIDVEITNAFREDQGKLIVSARMAQGEREALDANEEEKGAIVERWHAIMADREREKSQSKKEGKRKAQA